MTDPKIVRWLENQLKKKVFLESLEIYEIKIEK